jgi:hypothetical protein
MSIHFTIITRRATAEKRHMSARYRDVLAYPVLRF